jgi:arginase
MNPQPLNSIHIIGVRYRQTAFAPSDIRSLDAYLDAGVYSHAGVPFDYVEPRFPEELRTPDEPANLGILGGLIAAETAQARRQRKGVLMTGGDCNHITGVIGGLQDAHGAGARIGLVWFDAHGDFNTPHTTRSGMLGGMPVAVAAGLAYAQWREGSHIAAPLPTDRILMVDVRSLDPAEEQLMRATDVVIAAPAPGFPGAELGKAVNDLANRCDLIYLHIDSDVLDERFTPSHGTKEPHGPDLDQVKAAIETVMQSGKVAAFAVVSAYNAGEGREIMVNSAIEMIACGLKAWKQSGTTG